MRICQKFRSNGRSSVTPHVDLIAIDDEDEYEKNAAASHNLERQSDPLTPTDTESDHSTAQTVAFHRVQQTHDQYRTGRAERVSVRNGASLDVKDIFGNP